MHIDILLSLLLLLDGVGDLRQKFLHTIEIMGELGITALIIDLGLYRGIYYNKFLEGLVLLLELVDGHLLLLDEVDGLFCEQFLVSLEITELLLLLEEFLLLATQLLLIYQLLTQHFLFDQ